MTRGTDSCTEPCGGTGSRGLNIERYLNNSHFDLGSVLQLRPFTVHLVTTGPETHVYWLPSGSVDTDTRSVIETKRSVTYFLLRLGIGTRRVWPRFGTRDSDIEGWPLTELIGPRTRTDYHPGHLRTKRYLYGLNHTSEVKILRNRLKRRRG